MIACCPQGLCHVVDFRGLRPDIPTRIFARPCVPFSGPSLLQDMPHRYTHSAYWGYPCCSSAAIKGSGCFTGFGVYSDVDCTPAHCLCCGARVTSQKLECGGYQLIIARYIRHQLVGVGARRVAVVVGCMRQVVDIHGGPVYCSMKLPAHGETRTGEWHLSSACRGHAEV